jgi:subtilisin family serine protease
MVNSNNKIWSSSMMNKKLTVLLLASLFVLLNLSLYAQEVTSKIHPILQVVLLETPADETVDVYATLNEQYPLDELKQATAYLSRKERQKEVVRVLKEFATGQQQEVLAFLENAKQQNLVSHIDILWAGNTVVFSAVPQVIYNLAEDFDEIAEIRYDATIDESELIDPTEPSQPVPTGDETELAPQQGLILINAPAVWAEGDSGQGVLVSNNDSGCDWDHPDLIHNIWNNLGEDANNNGATIIWNGSSWVFDPGDINNVDDDGNGYVDDFNGWDFQGNDNNVGPNGTHGTSTAGIVCGDGTGGTQTGVAPRAKLMNCKISGEADSWLAIQYAVDNGVDITTSSHSYKWYFNPQPNYPMHRQMTDVELAAGVLHTNSTSNSGNSVGIPFNISAPGNCPGPWMHPDQTLVGGYSSVIGVGNVDAFSDIIVSSSPWGPWAWEDYQINHPSYPYPMPLAYQDYPYETIPGSMGLLKPEPGSMGLLKPDVSAPGSSTTSLSDGGGYSSFGGTSSATPHTAGTAALVLSINPFLTPEQVSMILQTTAVEKGAPGKDNRYGAGRIDAYEAYLLALAMIPVELSSFTANSNGSNVTLNWTTETETNNSGFSIERKSVFSNSWSEVGFVPGFGTTTERKNYNYNDEDLRLGKYSYRLKQIDLDGTFEYSNVIEVDVMAPGGFSLGQNYPNPFNPATTIEYSIPEVSNVTITVYSIVGELAATLVSGSVEAGYHRINFDASNLPSGTYIYQIKAVGESRTFVDNKKMILLK